MRSLPIAILFGFAALATAPLRADTYTFDLDHCSGGCGTGQGTITVVQDGANTVKITVAATGSGFEFVNSTSHGDDFLFDISGAPTISVSDVTSGWELVSPTAGSLGGGGWSFDYAMTCDFSGGVCHGSGGSHPGPASLSFDVTAAGLTAASFDVAGGGTTADFAADVISGGKTGLIGASLTSTTTSTTPEPAGVVLFGSVLVLAAGFMRRKLA